ncbi:cytochrome P450 [Flagelloscypha sp. PMI_526]|nr:cytochrome P450 [Flagelloscypha sp. PMI_526]
MSFPSLSEVGLVSTSLLLAYAVGSYYFSRQRRFQITTPLKGPSRLHPIWGWTKALMTSNNVAARYEGWVEEFGSIVGVPTLLWNQKIILTDPKAVNHFYANDPNIYGQLELFAAISAGFVGSDSIMTASGDQHKRLRKALVPAFSSAAIRRLTDVFFECAHKTKTLWEVMLDANGGQAILNIQDWNDRISLDIMGLAGFGNEFNSIDGHSSTVADLLRATATVDLKILDALDLFPGIPIPAWLDNIPTQLNKLIKSFRKTMSEGADELLSRTKQETKALGEHSAADMSLIGLLIKAESTKGSLSMTKEEVMSQMMVLLIAGYETTAISLTWALIELAKHPKIQVQLREELQGFESEPTYEQLISTFTLPILDGVVHEVLRFYPPFSQTNRVAKQDDVLPLSRPYTSANGTVVNHITIAKGSTVIVPIEMINCSKEFWGEDAKEFKPSRWFSPSPPSPKLAELKGHRHLLSFSDGPRICLGKNFALAEFKAALFVLIKHFSFEFKNGTEVPKFGLHRGFVNRPKVVGRHDIEVAMKVSRV